MAPSSGRALPSYSPKTQLALLKAVSLLFFPDDADDDFAENASSPTKTQTPRLTTRSRKANRVFRLEREVESLDELATGLILGQILNQLDSEFDPSQLETNHGASKYLNNKRNIQIVYKGLFRFIRQQVPALGYQAKKVDYNAIADSPDAQGISQVGPSTHLQVARDGRLDSLRLTWLSLQLLAIMVAAAALGPSNTKYVPRIQNSLDPVSQAEIMQILQTIQKEMMTSQDEDDLDEALDAVMESRDLDLLVEEKNAQLVAELDAAKKNLGDYITRLEHLQVSYEDLRYEKEKNDRELEVLRKATQDGATSAETVKILERRVHEQMEHIAGLEVTIQELETAKSKLEVEVKRLTQKSQLADELRDQVAEWKHKAEDLEKKANTAERYKQKLESQQNLPQEIQNLQNERAELQEQLNSLMDYQKKHSQTRKAEDELTKMITQSEQHLWDERSQKTQLLQDNVALQNEIARLEAQKAHDESFIHDLQQQLQEGGDGRGGNHEDGDSAFNLEDELLNAGNEDVQPKRDFELSRLKAENDLLRKTMGSTGEAALVRRELDEEKSKHERLMTNFNDIFERNAVAQSQIEALMNNMSGEGLVKTIDELMQEGPVHVLTARYFRTKAFNDQRNHNIQLQIQLEAAQKRIAALEEQNADQTRELLTVKTDLSAVDKDSIDALNELKSTDNLIAESLQGDLERLRAKFKAMTEERDVHKNQLVEVILAKEELTKAAQDGKPLPEAVDKDPDIIEGRKNQSEKIEKLRERLVERNEVSRNHSVRYGADFPRVGSSSSSTSDHSLITRPYPEALPPQTDPATLEHENRNSRISGFGHVPLFPEFPEYPEPPLPPKKKRMTVWRKFTDISHITNSFKRRGKPSGSRPSSTANSSQERQTQADTLTI